MEKVGMVQEQHTFSLHEVPYTVANMRSRNMKRHGTVHTYTMWEIILLLLVIQIARVN